MITSSVSPEDRVGAPLLYTLFPWLKRAAAGRRRLRAFALLLVYLPLWRSSYDPAVAIQFSGAFLAVGATGLWLGGVAIPHLVPRLTGLLVLTVAGERVELARVGG